MRVAVDISPLSTGHRVRGVGFYVKHLKDALEKFSPEHTYFFFNSVTELKDDFDLVHFPYFEPFSFFLPLFKRYRTVITVHDLTPLVLSDMFPAGLKGRARWELNKKVLKRVDAIITDSNASKNDIMRLTRIKSDNIHAIHLAPGEQYEKTEISNKQKDEILKKYDLPEKFILYVGDVTANKNLPPFLKAMKEAKIPVVLVGKALSQKDYDRGNAWNRDLIIAQHLVSTSPSLKAVGFVPDGELVVLYNLASCLVAPSLYEGFGLPVVEAMASGCPVACSNIPVFKEIVGDAACYFDPLDEPNMQEVVTKVYKDNALQKELQSKGLHQVKNYSWKKVAEKTSSVYKELR